MKTTQQCAGEQAADDLAPCPFCSGPAVSDADYASIVKRYEDAGDVQNADIIRQQWKVARAERPEVDADRDKLLTIIAAAYQIAGAHDAPAHILDVLADPEKATAAQVDTMLPYVPISPAQGGVNAHPKTTDTRMDAVSHGSGEPVGARREDALITVRFNDLMTLARQIIAEHLDDCDEEFMAGRAHGVGSLHSEILELSKRTALAKAQDTPKSAGASETCRSCEKAQVDPSPTCERKTNDIIKQDGYRKTGYVLQRTTVDRVCISDGGAVAWFTREEWNWLLFNRKHVEFQWPKPVSVLAEGSGELSPPSGPHQLSPRASAELAEEVLATLLWLYRRLPRGYGRPPTVERPILALAKLTGIDMADCLTERGPAATELDLGE